MPKHPKSALLKKKKRLKHERKVLLTMRPPALNFGQRPSTRGLAVPRKRWDARCSTCGGTGMVRSLSGFDPCPRCQ